ncbi:MAG: right-handed parallel beta-helix repeat-containing protein, partial [Bacteroidota bacterium]|nr:right-handed parallel beta-helix repeat-containing protein [Bacteroidota bacterium]
MIEILAAYAGTNEVFPITISVRTGSSAINTVTIRPRAGNTGEVIVGNINNAIINIDNADYIILDGRPGGTGSIADLTIQNQNSAGFSAHTIFFLNGATNNIVRYCNSLNATADGLGARNIGFGTSALNAAGNSNNLIENCVINGGRTGVGSSGTAANPNNMNTVRNCDIVDWGYAGIWHQSGTNNMLIENSSVHQTTGFNVSNPSGINIASTGVFNFTIRGNKIYNIKSISTSLSLTIRGIWTLSSP